MRFTVASTCAWSVTSQGKARLPGISFSSSASTSARRASMATAKPSAAHCFAQWSPMPLLPRPTTTQTFLSLGMVVMGGARRWKAAKTPMRCRGCPEN